MKQTIGTLTILIFVLCFATFSLAADKSTNAGCSNAALKGSYGFYRAGTTPDGPLAAVGILFYDGNGHSQSRQKISRNGAHEFSVASYEYEVAADCTSKTFANGNEIANGVVVDNGNRVFFFSLAEGNTVYGVAEKIRK